MKLLIVVLAFAIVAVNARSINEHEEELRNLRKLREEFKDVDAVVKADPQSAAITAMHFLNEVDEDIRRKLAQDSAKSATAMLDTTKSIGQRFAEMALIAQNTADLWKLAISKYNQKHDLVSNQVMQ